MKNLKLIIACLLLSASVLFTGCSNKTSDNTKTGTTSNVDTATNSTADTSNTSVTASSTETTMSNTDTTASNTDSSSSNQTFTLDELKTYNGKDGNPAYVAVDGIVYDVTNTKSWYNGSHQGLTAGEDLTSALSSSPHGDSVLANLPVVGTLE